MRRTLVVLGLAIFVLTGCALDTFVDCRNLSERYAECFDPDSDVDGCTSRCESRVSAGERDRADACDSCLDGQPTCAGATAFCTTDCGTLLAP